MPDERNNTPIRVVCASRLAEQQFWRESLTGKSLHSLRHTSPVELRLFSSNSTGLAELYNQAIEEVVQMPRILVFVHDDCLFTDFYWCDAVRRGLSCFDIIGIAGNQRRLPAQPSWIMVDLTGRQDDGRHLSGAIGQGGGFPTERLDRFGPPGVACKLLDGVLLATSSTLLCDKGLRFDARFAFHFYDMDFCRRAEQLNLRLGTWPLSLVHASAGVMDQRWLDSYRDYLDKWKE